MIKKLSARCVTSIFDQRMQIEFCDEEGEIKRVGDLGFEESELDFHFPDHCLLFAGMGDVHIHAREDISGKNTYKEDFLSATEAMTNGGLCHCGDMPNNPIPPIDDESYSQKFALTAKTQGRIWTYAGIGPKTNPLTFKVPYKAYMGPSIGELYFENFDQLNESLARYENQWVSFHCEDPEILEKAKNEATHFERRPVAAEVLATRDALALIDRYGLKGKLCHYSSGEGLDHIREFRRKGGTVMVEVTPQHLYFSQSNISDPEFYQMNPPIRAEADRKKMWEAVLNNEIDFLATDHAPHTLEEKKKGISGLTGLDTYASFVCWLITQKVPLSIIAKMTTENPGDFYNEFLESFQKLDPKHHQHLVGYLRPGYAANFTILNLAEKTFIDEGFLKTKVKHGPFLGITFPGKLEALFKEGRRLV